VVATLSTPFEIDTRNKILFLEEIGEPAYRLDRMLAQLKLAGKLDHASGFACGLFSRCPQAPDVLYHYLKGKPSCYGLPAGHSLLQATLPLGIKACLDAGRCRLTFMENALR